MTVVICPELNYLNAKMNRRKWTPEEDRLIRDYYGIDLALQAPLFVLRSARSIAKRQRELGLRQFSHKNKWVRGQ